MLSDKSVYRSPQALGPAYEHPEQLSDGSIEKYLRPLVSSEQRTRDPATLPRSLRQQAHAGR